MTSQNNHSPNAKQPLPILVLISGVLGSILCICICVISTSGFFLFRVKSTETLSTNQSTPDARIIISVAEDGCHVERTDLEGSSPVRMLTWVISDLDDHVLLERNAEGEYRYGYFQSGSYRVHMKGWYEGHYYRISNEVIIECP